MINKKITDKMMEYKDIAEMPILEVIKVLSAFEVAMKEVGCEIIELHVSTGDELFE